MTDISIVEVMRNVVLKLNVYTSEYQYIKGIVISLEEGAAKIEDLDADLAAAREELAEALDEVDIWKARHKNIEEEAASHQEVIDVQCKTIRKVLARTETAERIAKAVGDGFDLAAALVRANNECEDQSKELNVVGEELAKVRAENAGLREVLEFYGDPNIYFAIGFLPDSPCGDFMTDFEELDGELGHPDGGSWNKPGKRARAALAGGDNKVGDVVEAARDAMRAADAQDEAAAEAALTRLYLNVARLDESEG